MDVVVFVPEGAAVELDAPTDANPDEIAAAIELAEGFKASLMAALAEAKVADRLADGIVAVP